MSNQTIWLKIIIPCLYVGLAVISYLWDFAIVLNLLGIPWSIPLMMFSGPIVHATVNGNLIISVGSLIGVMLNIGLYLFILRRK
jgi:nitrate reductase gamma subunit